MFLLFTTNEGKMLVSLSHVISIRDVGGKSMVTTTNSQFLAEESFKGFEDTLSHIAVGKAR